MSMYLGKRSDISNIYFTILHVGVKSHNYRFFFNKYRTMAFFNKRIIYF